MFLVIPDKARTCLSRIIPNRDLPRVLGLWVCVTARNTMKRLILIASFELAPELQSLTIVRTYWRRNHANRPLCLDRVDVVLQPLHFRHASLGCVCRKAERQTQRSCSCAKYRPPRINNGTQQQMLVQYSCQSVKEFCSTNFNRE